MNTTYHQKILTLPRINLNARQLCDLELLLCGGFAPLSGFLSEEDYESVVSDMRLADGKLWPIPVVLDGAENWDLKKGSEVVLCDEYGTPHALLAVSSMYKADKLREAKFVYGTVSRDHAGVNYLMGHTGAYYLGGKLTLIAPIERYDYRQFRQTPEELKQWFAKHKWKTIIGFQTRNPLHRAHFEMMHQAASGFRGKILLHPTVGLTKEDDIDYITRIRCYVQLYERYMRSFATLSLLPLAMRFAGPREALWHAIIRKNYGCTHFIVGRDHASPGKDGNGKSFYGPYDAQKFVSEQAKEIAVTPVFFQEMVYVLKKKRFFPRNSIQKGSAIKNISGTKLRKMLAQGEEVPEWFSFPEIIAELRRGTERERRDGYTIFFTGLPSAGKSTIARMLYFRLLELQNKKVTLLDGDIVRQNLSKGLGFSREDRIANIRRIGYVANEITKHRGIAVCSAIAPHEEARTSNRLLISKNGSYVEVYVSTPLSVCKKRDTKGLYSRARAGLLKGLTGVDDPYEIPRHADITLNTTRRTAEQNVEAILSYLRRRGLLG